jgi:hypothetical protein
MAAGNLEIIGKCWAVDDGLDGSWHDGKPAKRECDGALVARRRCCNATGK